MFALAASLLLTQAAPVAATAPECPPETRAECEAIAATSRAFSAAYMAEDIAGLVGYYEPDGVAISGAREPVVGHGALRAYWALPEGADVLHHASTSTQIEVAGDMAFDRGTYEGRMRAPGGQEQAFSGNYLIVWTKGADGRWRMAQDMWAAK